MTAKKLLVITTQYPNADEPFSGVFNEQLLVSLRKHFVICVLCPIPFSVWVRYWIRSGFKSRIPERQEKKGIRAYYPILFNAPKIGRMLNPLLYFVSIVWKALRLRRTVGYDVIYSICAFPDGVSGVILGRLLGVPVVVGANGTDLNVDAKLLLRRIQIRWALKKSRVVFVASVALKRLVLEMGIPEEKVNVLYVGVNHDVFRPNDTLRDHGSIRRILYVGNLKQEKGVLDLVEAYSMLQDLNTELVIVGDGPCRRSVLQKIEKKGLKDRVRLVGWVPHEAVADQLRASSLLCLPSHDEGLPNVLLEAFACGVPVVATRVGGIPEFVSNEELGILVPKQDPQALAEALRSALEKKWNRKNIEAHARGFTWQRSAENFVQGMETDANRNSVAGKREQTVVP